MCELHNCSRSLPSACMATFAPSDQWQCLFALVCLYLCATACVCVPGYSLVCSQNLLPTISAPTLVMNSMVDSWQLLFAFNWRKLRIDDAYESDEILQVQ